MIKKIILLVVLIVVGIQFVRPSKNTTPIASQSQHIYKQYPTPAPVQAILEKACMDCHSDSTSFYYWYTDIQPIGWLIARHIKEGKKELNFSAFLNYAIDKQKKKLEKTKEAINENWMPLKSYTWTHKDAILSEAEKQMVTNWIDGCLSAIATTQSGE